MPDQTINHYQNLMADPVRMNAYHEAIRRTCRGKIVCEVGVGLGPISLMALKAGAERVYGIEMDGAALEVAIRVLRDNGYDESRFIPIHGMSHRVDLPERVDVVLSEILNSVAFGENALFFLEDARRRFLKPDGRMVPQSLSCYAALTNPATFQAERTFWKDDLQIDYGMDYSYMLNFLHHDNKVIALLPDEILTGWQRFSTTHFEDSKGYRQPKPVVFQLEKSCLPTGCCIAFDLTLTDGVRLSTLPGVRATHWQQGFCAFPEPIFCEPGDAITLQIIIPRSEEPRTYIQAHIQHIPAPLIRPPLSSAGAAG